MTERSSFLLRATEALRQARLLKPGPERNELRQVARLLRELARLDGAVGSEAAIK
ncbi:hypothetical protein JQ557_34875 [Bradyrhizobium sp. U87765 SZCCT0131]|uniref:hypothetical protein n=1 Tax=unclassified Bradyrhizobium TaxID=2631580 RepID=UPI001BA5C9F5|nr:MULTISPECIES: hypothetical protein [unclassified Bradyrhizobium]MBR1223227.1 hypothetical protein [Bradyrhizobium sp. U87765 SZCCT0131]MBR1265803.1 hypothetical protein [Bradyrhizobium sp. U87765 SZCCT0134]MBR1309226.1 hypothetical protein [Bradyrhizobium sp. U87765 SZCCT0110]MBR1323195.1 hypothetical protein [Bradyrhizobium sp. U87765 SZCCT0109]MBR1352452.1 hypothetical protein [Bradyrhizobium sp. U87765 SZCCT0048]